MNSDDDMSPEELALYDQAFKNIAAREAAEHERERANYFHAVVYGQAAIERHAWDHGRVYYQFTVEQNPAP